LKHWRLWRDLSIDKYREEYARLNVSFDVYHGESQVGRDTQDSAVERLEKMNLVSDNDGGKIIDLEQWKLGKAVVRKKGAYRSVPNTLCGCLCRHI
jgi:arginyl-tRNA synthetase